MKVCFPVVKADGLESKVYGHFGSAPAFFVVDTDDSNEATIINKDQHHVHGMCNPVKALNNQHVDAIVVGGIGGGALSRLRQMGIRVLQAQAETVRENLEKIKKNELVEFSSHHVCAGHGHGGGCGH
jgi:predicted Fe-Mo cluster-binding NifX family protein